MGGSLAPVRVAGFTWNGWQPSAVYAAQFTSEAFTGALKEHGIRISMDGKGCYHDNIFVERLWRSVKHECVYLTAFEDGRHLKQALHRYFRHYNQARYHQTLDYQTPDEVYYQQPMTLAA
jgi:putative transposase